MEKRLLALKALGLSLTFGTGLLQPAIFSRFLSTNELAYLFTFLGVVTYLSLFDAGAGRAFYIKIREKHTVNQNYENTFFISSIFYLILFAILLVLFFLSALVLIRRFELTSPEWVPFYTLYSLLVTVLALYRPIFYAIDDQVLYDSLDVLKRLLGLLFVAGILFGGITIASATVCLFAIVIIAPVAKSIFRGLKIQPKSRDLRSERPLLDLIGHSLVYSIAEISIYNFGYFVMPIWYSDREVVVFGFLMRFFLMMAMIVRVFGDVFLHRFSHFVHSKQYSSAKRLFFETQLLSTCVAAGLGGLFLFFGNGFLVFWVEGYEFTSAEITFVSVMVLANSVLHVSGVFAGATEKGLITTKQISIPSAILIGSTFALAPNFLDFTELLVLYAIIYSIFAVSTFVAFYQRVLQNAE